MHILYARCHCPIRVLHVLRGSKDCRDLTDEPQQCNNTFTKLDQVIGASLSSPPTDPSTIRTHACTHITLQSHIHSHTRIHTRIDPPFLRHFHRLCIHVTYTIYIFIYIHRVYYNILYTYAVRHRR